MPIQFHPDQGTILICDFSDFKEPEMTKRRPVVVVSPKRGGGSRLCTVVPCSTTPPKTVQPYHYLLSVEPPLPEPYAAQEHWVKADMLYTVSFERLFVPFLGKDSSGKRLYDLRLINPEQLQQIHTCISYSLGIK